ncbi:beta-propeller fold lactonase family protein [Deinococcus sp. VB142]|uniref:Beta-propeller fold lactonase family protein n=1 Tax=Deinococcus sp. VB142 TaxID=3112952 RepID=A0AAU6Q6Y4_9DEIO
MRSWSASAANQIRSDNGSWIDTQTGKKLADTAVGKAPAQVAFAPNGKSAYVSLRDENAIAVLDVTTRKATGKVNVGPGPIQVMVTSDSRFVLVANQGTQARPGNTLAVIDTASRKVVADIKTGAGAHGVTVDPPGRYVYVTNTYASTLAVVDLQARRTVATIPTGKNPNGVSFTPTVSPQAGMKNLNLGQPMDGGHDSHH